MDGCLRGSLDLYETGAQEADTQMQNYLPGPVRFARAFPWLLDMTRPGPGTHKIGYSRPR